ncbi:hypothetical protein COU57_00035 [Candidatus Pacearchaeota archaeon CG10_big_fil_rev_8_21_14_0_10_32_14]|nr:MAG: hypothetical protein COU57_00035 [Candidatus Pacearchaeota archaeon CG10_big_fil_rev_8_21_14_0_10_32_14]
MLFKDAYERNRDKLITDKSICKENRDLFKKFFEWEETKLKRTNGLQKLDEPTYKTLCSYITRFKNVNSWFENKAWINLTKKDIEKVYNDLEDGKIISSRGKRYGDLKSYYGKIFRSKPFDMAGKTHLVKEIMEFTVKRTNDEVRFVEEETIRKIINMMYRPDHKALAWLAFDVGENISSLLELRKKDFFRQINPDSKEIEYRVNLPKDKLKRTRQTRSEITNYKETVQYLDIVLKDLKDEDLLFPYCYTASKKVLDRAAKLVGAKCIPKGQIVTWKDFRSSMTCDLGKKGWVRDELNARLGHKPSSVEIDKYLNFIAYDRHKPKQKFDTNKFEKLQGDVEQKANELKLAQERIRMQKEESDKQQAELNALKKAVSKLLEKENIKVALN